MIANIVGYIKSDIVGLKNLFLAVGQPKAILKNKNPLPIYYIRGRSRVQNISAVTLENGTREQKGSLKYEIDIFG